MNAPNPTAVAERFLGEVRDEVTALGRPVRLVGILTHEAGPSRTYADYTRVGCEEVGIEFELRLTGRLDIEAEIAAANADPNVHGILIYYPVFGTGQDSYLKDLVDWRKDIEGFSTPWIRRLYANERFVDVAQNAKAILPCTPLAILKMLAAAGEVREGGADPAAGKVVTIFNRSEVVGRPLATMLANDGATVYSFDRDGPLLFEKGHIREVSLTRGEAIGRSSVVVTGVPSKEFPKIRAEEIAPGAVCLNFATVRNFEPEAEAKARVFIPRVGPVTVAMCLRNAARLFRTFHQGGS